jgi:anhydro-N-acetylmuramic acid kinase
MSQGLFLGAISGTSVDGLDLALVDVGARIRIVAAATVRLPNDLQKTLLALGQPGGGELDGLGAADAALGEFIGHSIIRFLDENGSTCAAISAVGSHGQTVRHRPAGAYPFTMQIGDPNRIAEITGITTVADFRRRDIAAGGQGAPLVPPFHEALFRHPTENRAVLNLGGIGNLTLLPADPDAPISGFDTGPANALMDDWILLKRSERFDRAGAWAATGSIHQALLDALLQDPYLVQPPPKSTGREHYNLAWLRRHLPEDAADADVQATLCAFTVESVARALETWGAGTQRVLLCGGGRHNRTLLASLAHRLPCPAEATDHYGADGDFVEAAAFAWLAHRTISGRSGNAPTVTGARGTRVLGAIYGGSR